MYYNYYEEIKKMPLWKQVGDHFGKMDYSGVKNHFNNNFSLWSPPPPNPSGEELPFNYMDGTQPTFLESLLNQAGSMANQLPGHMRDTAGQVGDFADEFANQAGSMANQLPGQMRDTAGQVGDFAGEKVKQAEEALINLLMQIRK